MSILLKHAVPIHLVPRTISDVTLFGRGTVCSVLRDDIAGEMARQPPVDAMGFQPAEAETSRRDRGKGGPRLRRLPEGRPGPRAGVAVCCLMISGMLLVWGADITSVSLGGGGGDGSYIILQSAYFRPVLKHVWLSLSFLLLLDFTFFRDYCTKSCRSRRPKRRQTTSSSTVSTSTG